MRSLLMAFIVMLSVLLLHAQDRDKKPTPRVIHLDPRVGESTDIFTGPPTTMTMHSGYMVLAPGKSVGKHSTKDNEEALVVLAGRGEMRITNGPVIALEAYDIAYCPPTTEHDVRNTGVDTLRYIWLVAKAK